MSQQGKEVFVTFVILIICKVNILRERKTNLKINLLLFERLRERERQSSPICRHTPQNLPTARPAPDLSLKELSLVLVSAGIPDLCASVCFSVLVLAGSCSQMEQDSDQHSRMEGWLLRPGLALCAKCAPSPISLFLFLYKVDC